MKTKHEEAESKYQRKVLDGALPKQSKSVETFHRIRHWGNAKAENGLNSIFP